MIWCLRCGAQSAIRYMSLVAGTGPAFSEKLLCQTGVLAERAVLRAGLLQLDSDLDRAWESVR